MTRHQPTIPPAPASCGATTRHGGAGNQNRKILLPSARTSGSAGQSIAIPIGQHVSGQVPDGRRQYRGSLP